MFFVLFDALPLTYGVIAQVSALHQRLLGRSAISAWRRDGRSPPSAQPPGNQ
ncbi:hypothetical protein ACFFWD_21755 [Bradyrhizobium erythrophlei]|uniref:hypothetical protein n=1 Tax=Bradyrhizobium erythrophlei TaxID=1437360 RepID=UPI0035E4DA42